METAPRSSILKRLLPCAAALLLASCNGTTPAPQVNQIPSPDEVAEPLAQGPLITDVIRIAVVMPLSGPQSRLGEAMAQAVQMAFFEAQDPRLSLRFFDSLGADATPATRGILIEDVAAYAPKAVIGPLFSETAQALAPALLAQNIPVLSFSNDIAANAAGAILLGQQPEQEVARVLTFIAGEAETRRLGMIVPNDMYGQRVRAAMVATVNALNDAIFEEREALARAMEEQEELLSRRQFARVPIFDDDATDLLVQMRPPVFYDIVEQQTYGRDLRSLDGPARRIAQFDARVAEVEKERAFLTALDDPMGLDYLDSIRNIETFRQPKYDILLVGEGGQLLRALAPMLTVYAIDEQKTQLIGTGLWNDPALTREPALHGGLFAAAPASATQRFGQRYQDQFGARPPALAATAYDAMAVIALAARDDRGDPTVFAPARLFAETGFKGASGLFRILPSGICERTLAVMKITESGLETVDPAPLAFPIIEPEAEAPKRADTLSR